MGCKIKAEDFEYLQAVKNLGYLVSTRFVTPWQRVQFLYDLTSNKRQVVKYTKIMNNFTTKIITQRRALVEKENNENLKNLDDDDVGLKKKMCLLDVLLQSSVDGKPLSNADIQEEVNTFTFAGKFTIFHEFEL